jgi:hypothetical protein
MTTEEDHSGLGPASNIGVSVTGTSRRCDQFGP